jgi:hypothetical protein
MSANRVKPGYILNGTDRGNSSFNLPVDVTPATTLPTMPPHELHALVTMSISPLASTSEQPSLREEGG